MCDDYFPFDRLMFLLEFTALGAPRLGCLEAEQGCTGLQQPIPDNRLT